MMMTKRSLAALFALSTLTGCATTQMAQCTAAFGEAPEGQTRSCKVEKMEHGYKSVSMKFADKGGHGESQAIIAPDGKAQNAKSYYLPNPPMAPATPAPNGLQ